MYMVDEGAKRAIKAPPILREPVPEIPCTAQYYSEVNYKAHQEIAKLLDSPS
jgi:hypothetical protein